MTKSTRGRIENMTFAEYRAAPGVNLSRLKMLDVSPRKYAVNPGKDSKSLGIGRACHTAILEPHLFGAQFVVWEGRKAGNAYKEFKAAHADKEILNVSESTTVHTVAGAVNEHPVAAGYFSEGTPEQTVFWTHPLGIECKSRIDWLRDDCIVDLKTARDVTGRGFGRAAATYDYAAQLAFYHDAAKSVDGLDRKVVLLAAETAQPFDVVPYVLPEEALQAGRRRYTDWLLLLLKCQAEDRWPGVSETETELQLPAWYFDEFDDAVLTIGGIEVAV